MKLPNLSQLSKKQKVAAVGVAGAGAVALGLRSRARGGATAAMSTVQPAGKMGTAGGAIGSYDSTASDVYDSLQPQIESLIRQVEAINASPPIATSPVASLNPVQPTVIYQPYVPPVTQAPPAAAVPPAAADARNDIYGTGTPATIMQQLPTVSGGVQAPQGAQFQWGTWRDGVLVSGTYKLPDGSLSTVKK